MGNQAEQRAFPPEAGTEAKPQRRAAELEQILDSIPQLIAAISASGEVLYLNRSARSYSGLRLEDVRAEGFRVRLFHPEDVERLQEARRRGFLRGQPFELEMRTRRHDGVYRWFLVQYEPLNDADGRISRWCATGTDIDDRKRAEDRVRGENEALRDEIDRAAMFEDIVGSSDSLCAVLRELGKVAATDSTVLVMGETGTGKELIARAIHKRSPRSGRAFVSVNCGAIPTTLLASELFGHERGAFSGAIQQRLGRFELAEGGTIFLDEVGELPFDAQAALLRVLQEREIERVGGSRPIRVDVRVIAATNRDLQVAAARGTFRSDLFYRLNVFPLELPPLRERRGDIRLLVEYFVDRFAKRSGRKITRISEKSLDVLNAYPWPGNIRELQNVIERAVILAEGNVLTVDERWFTRAHLASIGGQATRPPAARQEGELALSDDLAERELARIEAALAASRGRVAGPSGAAAMLGVPRSTLESKIRLLQIDKHRFKSGRV
jgi:formate hydrogenlyase transcriptional activator